MRPGDVIRLRHFRHYFAKPKDEPGAIWDDWRAPKGEAFVCLVLGTDPNDGSAELDVVEALKALGWTPPAESIS